MDLVQLRVAYHTGNYQKVASALTGGSIDLSGDYPEALVLTWKAVMRASGGDVSKCAAILTKDSIQAESVKKSLMLWSKTLKSPNSSDSSAFKALALQAHESADLSAEERDQIIVTAAEGCMLSSNINDAFSLLKLLKASNLDRMTFDRFEKMKNIPEWKDDIRFLLCEARLGLQHGITSTENSTENFVNFFTPKDSLYSYQELIQVHGETCKLQMLISAAYAALGKFSEAHSTLLQIRDPDAFDEPVLKANLIVTSAYTLDSNHQFTPALKYAPQN